jgi:1,4-alpha-glucan branching enzyme
MPLPIQRNSKFKQGYFHPRNIHKLIGHDVPAYRSGIELEFMKWCDNNEKVIKWGSECVQVPYRDTAQRKNRLYFVDNYVEILEGDTIKKYLIELKDIKETRKPDPRSKKKKTALLTEQFKWQNNTDKWKFAIKYAKDRNMEFLLLGHSKKDGFLPISLDFMDR